MGVSYSWLMEIKELPEERKEETPEHFHSRVYSECEAILDARRDLDVPWDRETRKAMRHIHIAQKYHALWLCRNGQEDYYGDWSKWWHFKQIFATGEFAPDINGRLYHLRRSIW